MKIIFEAKNIADLKLQIQEYSLAHLGLNIKAMAEEMIPKKPQPSQPGKSESVRLNDGTERLHNPSYPGPMKNPRGRPVGWRKNPAPEPEPEPEPKKLVITPAVPTEPFLDAIPEKVEVPPPPDPDFASKDEVKAAIHELNKVKGFEVAKSALEKFGAKHLNDVAIADFKALVIHCGELQNA